MAEETIKISKEDFDALVSKVDTLEKAKNPTSFDDNDLPVYGGIDKKKDLTAHVTLYKERPIVKISEVVDKGKGINGKPIMECVVHTVGKDSELTEHKKVDYYKLITAPFTTCRVLSVEQKPITKPGPVVTVKVWSDEKQAEIPTGKRVRAAINFIEEEFTIEWNGEEFKTKEINLPN